MYHQSEGEEAMKHFAQILERNPSENNTRCLMILASWLGVDCECTVNSIFKIVERSSFKLFKKMFGAFLIL